MRKSGSIARNSALNLVGFTVPMLVGLLTVPIITRELGPARFGLLSLGFAILEYSSLFDLGLGVATTREVSAALERRDKGLSSVILGSIASQAALGTLGALILIAISAPLVDNVFVIPPELRSEAVAVFRVLALMIPPTVILLSLRGILEAAGRFDISNAIRIPSSIATFLVPAVAAAAGYDVAAIVLMLLVTRIFIVMLMALAVTRVLAGLSWKFRVGWDTMRPLFVFGGWMSVSNIVTPMLLYVDRFILGAVVGVAAVGYYTAPFDGVMRLLIIPASLMGALYPSVSAMLARKDYPSIQRVFRQAIRKTVLLLVGPALVLGIAGPWLLEIWLGPVFASEAEVAVRVLAFGVFLNALARVPSGFVSVLGRPDLLAKINIGEMILHLPMAWFLIARFGVTGAAIAWTIRVGVDAVVLLFTSSRILGRIHATR